MKSRDIAIVGILLAIGAIVRYLSLIIPGPIVANLVIAFYCLAILLVLPTLSEAIGIGFVAGLVSALISHSVFPPGNLISEPIGAVVCVLVYRLLMDRVPFSQAITTFIATIASGGSFVLISLVAVAPTILSKYATFGAYALVVVPIILTAAVANSIIAQAIYMPAARAVMRDRPAVQGLPESA